MDWTLNKLNSLPRGVGTLVTDSGGAGVLSTLYTTLHSCSDGFSTLVWFVDLIYSMYSTVAKRSIVAANKLFINAIMKRVLFTADVVGCVLFLVNKSAMEENKLPKLLT